MTPLSFSLDSLLVSAGAHEAPGIRLVTSPASDKSIKTSPPRSPASPHLHRASHSVLYLQILSPGRFLLLLAIRTELLSELFIWKLCHVFIPNDARIVRIIWKSALSVGSSKKSAPKYGRKEFRT